MTKTKSNTINNNHYYVVLASLILLLLGVCYVYLLSATVVHVVMQKEITRNINDIHSEIAKIESKYIARQHAVSNEIASLEGFVEAEHKVFINKSDTSLVLSSN